MGKCLQCGKEIPEGRKFCSSSCSAKYNNVRRERKPWTEEQKQRIRRVQPSTCLVCGKQIRARRSFCSDCQRYSSSVPILNKLGVWTGNVLSDIKQAEQLLRKEYFENKESLLSLSRKYRINKDTVKTYISRTGESIRSLSEGVKVSIEQGRLVPSQTPSFKTGSHTSWEGKVFHYRSSWEEQLMQELDSRRVSYLYEPFTLRYFDTQKQEERIAIPDFFFPESNTIVELKSSFTYDEQNIRDKFKAYRERGYKAKLILDWTEMPL